MVKKAISKPIITYSGAVTVFQELECLLQQSLPQEACEWNRCGNRAMRKIYIGATFVPFSEKFLGQLSNDLNLLLKEPIFHTFWTDCADLDTYKSQTKADIEVWFANLQKRDITDWMVVVVESHDSKRLNKLLSRTTVLEKLRSDFGYNKFGDKFVSVFNPKKSENRYSESWRGLNSRIRTLLLAAYDSLLIKIENNIKKEREHRNNSEWDYLEFFQLQEHLASIYEMLGVYDEALVQYDELDCLLGTIISEKLRGKPTKTKWFESISQPIHVWNGLKLMEASDLDEMPSLVQLRTYLFTKQAHMLLLDMKPSLVAARLMPFIFTTLNELNMLEVRVEVGSMDCWACLACLEVIQVCANFKDLEHQELIVKNSARILEFAAEKLNALGQVCGLLLDQEPTSAQLHLVVLLSAGMGDCSGPAGSPSPTDRLKQSLLSKEKFRELYIELCQQSITIYKTIGYNRCVALLGKNMADFYLGLADYSKALIYLNMFLEILGDLKWVDILVDVHKLLHKCFKELNDFKQYYYSCSILSSVQSLSISEEQRLIYFHELMSYQSGLKLGSDCFSVNNITILSPEFSRNGYLVQNDFLMLSIELENRFPLDLTHVIFELTGFIVDATTVGGNCFNTVRNWMQRDFVIDLDFREDKQISSASVCQAVISRADKNVEMKVIKMFNFVDKDAKNLKIGLNTITFNAIVTDLGYYKWDSLKIKFANFEHVTKINNKLIDVNVISFHPDVELVPIKRDLIMGFEQKLQLKIVTELNSDNIRIESSKGLLIKSNSMNSFSDNISVKKELSGQQIIEILTITEKTDKSKEYELKVSGKNLQKVLKVVYTPLFYVDSNTLIGANYTKFLKVDVMLLHSEKLCMEDVRLIADDDFTKSLNVNNSIKMNFAKDGAKFLWQIMDSAPIQFSVQFQFTYKTDNNVSDQFSKTLTIENRPITYVISEDIEPLKDSEFCRSGFVCNLKLTVTKILYDIDSIEDNSESSSVMYEILPQQNMWGMCSKTSGVIDNESLKQGRAIILEMMPLINGFLPMPQIRISKYIHANQTNKEALLEQIDECQVYNNSEAKQVRILPSAIVENHS